MADQAWFEMREIRETNLEGGVWIPLRALRIERNGRYGHVGYREDFNSTVTLAIRKEDESLAGKLKYRDLTQGFGNHGYVEDSVYIPSDIYDHFGEFEGIYLVLEQKFGSLDDESKWILHQDLVLTLGLKREADVWVRPDEGYEVVARENRVDGELESIAIRSEHLKDYMCARNLCLATIAFRSRTAVLASIDEISWTQNHVEESDTGVHWIGEIAAIHEGGDRYGAKTAIFHISREETDGHRDVPVLERPNDQNIRTSTREFESSGRKLYRVSGELWRKEVIQPGSTSPIIRGDQMPSAEAFIVDAEGTELSGAELQSSMRWLWFNTELVMSIAHKRGGSLRWYTKETGQISWSGHEVHFGVNSKGLINAYAKDVALLPRWLRRIWAGQNVRPDGGVSQELLAAQVEAEPADTFAPEVLLPKSLDRFEHVFHEVLKVDILRPHYGVEELLDSVHRFRAINQTGFLALAKDLYKLTVERMDVKALRTLIQTPEEEKWGSLKALEKKTACDEVRFSYCSEFNDSPSRDI